MHRNPDAQQPIQIGMQTMDENGSEKMRTLINQARNGYLA
ncbi:hypothetical protein BX592_10515 [Paraburkholderia rhizosphaerae]|uniref:Uncharacterized protein n=1 Tax=Paraburkholderia rhizosphaerae TaxID=480658 RepID=A0A4R8LZ48_9BURK|nr:hypothetical protein BX592_10515 [Paraburkholderia rhizosphaerae]